MLYLNLVVHTIKRLRNEAAEAAKTGMRSSGGQTQQSQERRKNLLTTHLQVLAGKPGTLGTWSIEKQVTGHWVMRPNFFL
jgi:hypothetical protein